MDRMSALLDGPRARQAFVLRCLLEPSWSIEIRDGAPLTVCAVVRGDAWIDQGGRVVHLAAGTTALVLGPEHYTLSSDPGRSPDVIVHEGQRCETVGGESLEMSMRLGVRSWGHSPDAPTVLVTGTYEHDSAIGAEALSSLPTPSAVAHDPDHGLVRVLADELTRDGPGQQTILDRLVDAVTIDTVRSVYARHPEIAPSWWSGHVDPLVGEVLRLMHDAPAHPWTIAELAREVGTSRANLARRFGSVVGEPVISYLTRWRLGLAADLLAHPDATVTSVARQVGYGSPFSLSAAFSRRFGVSPSEHRATVTAAGPAVGGAGG